MRRGNNVRVMPQEERHSPDNCLDRFEPTYRERLQFTTHTLRVGGSMADKRDSHHHPDYDQRIKALEEQVKKLDQELQQVRQKLDTHDHPHSH